MRLLILAARLARTVHFTHYRYSDRSTLLLCLLLLISSLTAVHLVGAIFALRLEVTNVCLVDTLGLRFTGSLSRHVTQVVH